MSRTDSLPRGLLLDFGGVIVNSTKPEGWQQQVTDEILGLLDGVSDVGRERLLGDITAGAVAAGLWRNAMSRPRYPRELDQRSYVMDFIAADWPQPAREAIEPHIARVCYLISDRKEQRELREGIEELLIWCRQVKLPVAIVSNAMCGQVHRDYLVERALDGYFAAELYSDECGIRKPNPHFLEQGAAALGLEVADCWYVGDHLDRDVLCGVRAGIGVNVLMPSPGSTPRPFTVPVSADLVLDTPEELLNEMRSIHERA
ncbi:HAD family hydrolase [Glutamicibacter sp. MNS18]|uniref:HAD family hydrolase n=1 Tax=Glutamicibacter sp. MNS18 TaxID=2989817 RepID=UPI0022368F55|nr:HAD family hydrolase [Glutamicibacter sp. MNS18]MCW4466548.1 HAD family hydrolase [Glutamicibacter sp. MNS18]